MVVTASRGSWLYLLLYLPHHTSGVPGAGDEVTAAVIQGEARDDVCTKSKCPKTHCSLSAGWQLEGILCMVTVSLSGQMIRIGTWSWWNEENSRRNVTVMFLGALSQGVEAAQTQVNQEHKRLSPDATKLCDPRRWWHQRKWCKNKQNIHCAQQTTQITRDTTTEPWITYCYSHLACGER